MINNFVALDVETSGLNPSEDKIIEIGMAKVCDGVVTESYSTLVDPRVIIPDRVVQLTGITQDMLQCKPQMGDIIGDIIEFIGDLPILGHNVVFDYSFIKKAAVNAGYKFDKCGIDTLKLARRLLPQVEHKNLEYLCTYFGIDAGSSHRAYDDAVSAMRIYYKMHEIKPDDEGFTQLIQFKANVKKDSPVTAAQKSYLNALIIKHNITLDADIDSLTKSKASKYIDGIIAQYGK